MKTCFAVCDECAAGIYDTEEVYGDTAKWDTNGQAMQAGGNPDCCVRGERKATRYLTLDGDGDTKIAQGWNGPRFLVETAYLRGRK